MKLNQIEPKYLMHNDIVYTYANPKSVHPLLLILVISIHAVLS